MIGEQIKNTSDATIATILTFFIGPKSFVRRGFKKMFLKQILIFFIFKKKNFHAFETF